MPQQSKHFLSIASSKDVVLRALRIAAVVGTILAFINHGDSIVALTLSIKQTFQILLTYLVPYSVATYTSVRTIQGSK